MKLKQTSALFLALSMLLPAGVLASTCQRDSSAFASRKTIVGPEELGSLIDPEELFRQNLEKKFEKKAQEEAAFKKHLELQAFYILLDETETFMEPGEGAMGTLGQLSAQFKESKDWKSLALILNTYAVYYGKNDDLQKSLDYFKESLQAVELSNDKHALAKTTGTVADLSRMMGRLDDAAFYYEYNARTNAGLKRAVNMAEAYLNIGEIKARQGKYTEAEHYVLRKAFPMFQRMGSKNGRLSCFENLAEIYHRQNRLSEAKWFYLQAHTLAAKLHNLPVQVSSLMQVARIKNESGETEMALADYKTAELLARQYSFTAKLVEIKSDVVEIYRKNGNYVAAGTALDEYNRLKKSLLKENM